MDAQTGGGDGQPHPEVLINENPLAGPFQIVIGFIQSYGWVIVFGMIVCYYLKSKLSPAYNQYRRKLEETIENKKYDPVKAEAQMERMEAARRRMQEQLDAQAARHAEQMKQKEEEKRKQMIEDWDGHVQGKGYRSKSKKTPENSTESSRKLKSDQKPKPLRDPDYNPLAGDGGSCTWRPGQRGGGARGGG